MIDLIRIDSETVSHLEHLDQRDELYDNHTPVGSRRLLCNTSTHPIIGSSLLDGYIDWYRKLFLCYQLRFEPMRSHALKEWVRYDG